MKKILAIFMSALLMLAPFTMASAADESSVAKNVIDKFAEYTPEERANMIAYLRPFVTTDAGVSAGISNLQSGSMGSMITGMFGGAVNEDTLIRVFKSFSCIKEDTGLRLEYADIFQAKIELEDVSTTTVRGVEKMMNGLYQKLPSLEKICKEDNFTAGVVANMFTIIPKINGNKELIAYEDGAFVIAYVDETFRKDFDAVWADYTDSEGKTVTYEKFVGRFVDVLNAVVPDSDKSSVAKALADLGVCKVKTTSTPGGGGTGGGGTGGGNTTTKPEEKPTTNPSGDNKDENKDDNSMHIQFDEGTQGVVEVVTDLKNPVVTKVVNGTEQPVVLSIPSENGVRILVENNTKDTEYVISEGKNPFTDVNGWGKDYIVALAERGVINGMTATTFEPEAYITREQFVTLVVKMFGLLDETATTPFADVKADAWYAPYVASAYKHGIVNGVSETEFGVGQNIKRQDMAKIINTVLAEYGIEAENADSSAFKDFASIAGYAQNHVLAICGLGIVSGDDNQNFNPVKLATRQEAAKMIYGMLDVYVNSLAK